MLFHGVQRMQFLHPKERSPETGLYLVLAANNAGKTSFIRALKFLFYGADAIGGGVTRNSIVCQKTLAESQIGHAPKCYVEARVVHHGSEYTLRRELAYLRGKNSTTRAIGVDEHVVYIAHNPTRDETVSDPGKFAYRVGEMVPKDLFDFFFFKGEELSSKLLEGDTNHSLQDSLMAIFHKADWDLAEEHLRELQKTYHAKVVTAQKRNAEASGLLEEKEDLLKSLADHGKLLKSLREAHHGKKAAFEELEKQVVDAASSKHEQLKAEITSLRDQIRSLAASDDDHHRRLFREISQHGPLVLLSAAFPRARTQLEALHQKKILPAEVSEDFFSQLLSDKLCVCSRSLPDGSIERKRVEERRAVCLSANVGQSLHRLNGLLNPDNMVGFTRKAVKGLETMRQESVTIEKIRSKKLDLDEQLRIRNEKLEALPEMNLQALVQQKKGKEDELRALERKITTAEIDEANAKQSLAGIDRQLTEMGISGEAEPDDLAAEAICLELAQRIEEMREGLQDSFSEKLQNSVAALYKQIVTDQSVAVIDPASLLPSIRLNGQTGIAAGGAQSQALCLAYILSLASLRREVAAEMKELFYGNKTPPSGDQAFVMDSVFAPMQGNYIRETAEFLPGKAKQLIMLLSAKQFDEKVQRIWASASKGKRSPIDKAWRFLFHMPPDKYEHIESDERVAVYAGKPVELFAPLTNNAHQFSEIKEL